MESYFFLKEGKMKFVNFYRKPISVFVMVSFTVLLCFWANQAPAAPAPVKNSETTMEQGDSSSPNFIEEIKDDEATVKKPKKFPLLLVGAVVVVGAALYFLVLKKSKLTLTVTLGAGTSGTPATGKYKKGEVVAYSFSTQAGYAALKVMLDGVEVAAAGNVTMDKDHTITTSASQGAIIQVNSTPAGAKIYMDKVDSGFVTPHTFNYPGSTSKQVLVRMCGYQDYSKTQTVALGQTATIDAALVTGIKEDFNVPASSCWVPNIAANWSTSNGAYKFSARVKNWTGSYYDNTFNGNYTVTVKMRRVKGSRFSASAIYIGDSNNLAATSGYVFQYTANGSFGIWMAKNYNIFSGTGGWAWIRYWAGSAAIGKGLGIWNTLKVVKAGSNYTFYINNTMVYSFSNSTYNPKYAALAFYGSNEDTIMEYDYVYLSPGATAGSIPGLPATPFTATGDVDQCQSEK